MQLKSYMLIIRENVPMSTFAQVVQFLKCNMDQPQGKVLLCKAIAAIGFIGGLRMAEIKALSFACLDKNWNV